MQRAYFLFYITIFYYFQVTNGAKQHKKEAENQEGKSSNRKMKFLIINMVFAFVFGCWFGNNELREQLQSARNLNKQIVESLSKETFWFYNFKSRYEMEDSQNKKLREELEKARRLNKEIVESLSEEKVWYYDVRSSVSKDLENSRAFALENKVVLLQKQIKSRNDTLYFYIQSNFEKEVESLKSQIHIFERELDQSRISNEETEKKLRNQLDASKKLHSQHLDTVKKEFSKVTNQYFYVKSNYEKERALSSLLGKEVETLMNQIKNCKKEADQTKVSNEASEKKLRNQLNASKKLHGQHLDTVRKEFSKVTNEYFYVKSNYEKEKALANSLEKEVEALKIEVEDFVFGISELLLKDPKKRANLNNENPMGENVELNESDLRKWKISKESESGTVQLINKAKGTLNDFEQNRESANNQWILSYRTIVPYGMRKAQFTNMGNGHGIYKGWVLSLNNIFTGLPEITLMPMNTNHFDQWLVSETDPNGWMDIVNQETGMYLQLCGKKLTIGNCNSD